MPANFSSIALIIPVKNEEDSIASLIYSVGRQRILPDEIVIVDGGSVDKTVSILKSLKEENETIRIVETSGAMPGVGRNIGAEHTTCEWLAFTDAGIKLDRDWLYNLIAARDEHADTDIVYGNYSPVTNTFFTRCAAITYVPPMRPGKIRDKFIASSLLRKTVWEKAGGFPEWRAAEDLIFMEKAEANSRHTSTSPTAMVEWELRPGLKSTFRRFDLYSKYNVWAGKQAGWHYGIAKQYILLLAFVLAALFIHWVFILALPLWMFARTIKRIYNNRYELRTTDFFNPLIYIMVGIILLTVDAATFTGWIKAALWEKKRANPQKES